MVAREKVCPGPPRSDIQNMQRMKDWTPDRDFGKADFTRHKKKAEPGPERDETDGAASGSVGSAEVVPATTDATAGRVVKSWRPPSIQHAAGRATEARGEGRPTAFERLSPAATGGAGVAGGPPVEKAASDDMSARMMGDLVLSRPADATELLRRWYWDRAQPASHARIHIVLRSIPREALVELYRFFTALERRQMHEIYSRDFAVAKSEILTARRQFMEALSG